MGVGRRLGGRLAVSVAGTRKVCPDGVDSCGDPFRRNANVYCTSSWKILLILIYFWRFLSSGH